MSKVYINVKKSVPLVIGQQSLRKCGDMQQYFQDNPDKLKEKMEKGEKEEK